MTMFDALSERSRVAQHIARASAALAPSAMHAPIHRLTRALVRVALERYRERGVFPRNHRHVARTPYFVDAHGTPCAVAHLLALSGETALVSSVQRTRNHATVRELASEPRFGTWLAAVGLSVAEAQAIQPTYSLDRAACVCGGAVGASSRPALAGDSGPADGVLVGEVRAVTETNVRVYVQELHGAVGTQRAGDTVVAPMPGGWWGSEAPSIGARVLVPVHLESPDAGSAITLVQPIVLDEQGEFSCDSGDYRVGPLDEDQLRGVLVAPDCTDALAEINPRWTKVEHSDTAACALAPGVSVHGLSASLGVLLALASALAVRRR